MSTEVRQREYFTAAVFLGWCCLYCRTCRCIPSHRCCTSSNREIFVQPISLLGSTGSIGTQTLDICAEYTDRFDVVALAAGRNIELLAKQIKQFQPKLVGISDGDDVNALKELIKDAPSQPEIVVGVDGQCAVASHADIEAVVTGIVGCAGLKPTCAAIEAGKDICLANKETLIAGGPAVLPLAAKHGVHILPADSEHSALFQCIQGMPEGGLRRIVLTASGGAFRDWPVEKLDQVTVRPLSPRSLCNVSNMRRPTCTVRCASSAFLRQTIQKRTHLGVLAPRRYICTCPHLRTCLACYITRESQCSTSHARPCHYVPPHPQANTPSGFHGHA